MWSSTVSLTIEAPEQVEAPYRWPTRRSGDAPFPHACVKTETDEIEYQLASSRQTSLTCKFNHSNGVDVLSWGDFSLSLQVKIHETWEDVKDSFFEPINSVCASPYATLLSDNSIKWVVNGLHKLSSTTPDFTISESGYVHHEYCKQSRPVAEHGLSIDYGGSKRVRLFRFKAIGEGRNENKGQSCEAYTVPFATVYKTISGEQARKRRLNPAPGPTEHERELQEKREASKAAARSIHNGERQIPEALIAFPGSTRRLIRKELGALRKGGVTGGDEEDEAEEDEEDEYDDPPQGDMCDAEEGEAEEGEAEEDDDPPQGDGMGYSRRAEEDEEDEYDDPPQGDMCNAEEDEAEEGEAKEDDDPPQGDGMGYSRRAEEDEEDEYDDPPQGDMCDAEEDMGYSRRRIAIAEGEPGVEESQPRAPVVCSSGKAESAEDGKGKEKEDDGEEDEPCSVVLKSLKEPCSVVLKRLKEDSIAMLDPSRYRHSSSSRHRTQHVNSLYAEVIEIARGLEGQGVDLGVVERARLDFGGRPFNPVDNALDDSLHGYMNAAYAGVAGERAFEQRDVDDAVAMLKKRIYNNEELSFWEQKVQRLRARHDMFMYQGNPNSEACEEVGKELTIAKQMHKAAGEKPLTVADEFTKAALANEAAVRCAERGSFGADLKTIVQSSSDVITATLSFISPPPPPSTIGSWHTFRRRATRVYDDMRVSLGKKWSLRCDARFLVGELSDDDASAMKRGAELLRTLAEHVKLEADGTPSAALPLAASPKLVDGGSGQPEPAMRTAAVAAVEQSTPPGMTLCVLPANDAIEGSCETTMYMPIALRSMPPRCILRFIAERSPLPSRPRGSKRLAERALPDALRLLETFMDEELHYSDTSLCPFRSYGELHPDIVRKLRGKAKNAAARLRGEPEPEPEPEPRAESSHAPVTSGIELDEEDSGPCGDEDGEYSVRYTFNLALKDGRVEQWTEETEFKDITDRRRFKDFADCEEFYLDPSNRKMPEQRAHAQLNGRNKDISRQEKTAATRKCIEKWDAIRNCLMQSARNAASKDMQPQLVALCNAADALRSEVEMKSSYKDGDPEFSKHGSARSAHENEGRRARRTTKCKDNDEEAASASVQLDCERDLETRQKVGHFHALTVLKGIAVKADLRVIPLAETVRHDTKGTRTTKRAHIIPIKTHDELFKVADVVLESIEIFRYPSREVEQEAWKKAASQHPALNPTQKRKRGA